MRNMKRPTPFGLLFEEDSNFSKEPSTELLQIFYDDFQQISVTRDVSGNNTPYIREVAFTATITITRIGREEDDHDDYTMM